MPSEVKAPNGEIFLCFSTWKEYSAWLKDGGSTILDTWVRGHQVINPLYRHRQVSLEIEREFTKANLYDMLKCPACGRYYPKWGRKRNDSLLSVSDYKTYLMLSELHLKACGSCRKRISLLVYLLRACNRLAIDIDKPQKEKLK
jgi:hypothetical protein